MWRTGSAKVSTVLFNRQILNVESSRFQRRCGTSEAAWEAANAAMTTFGGYGLAVEYGIERKFREARLYKVAPISNNLVLTFVGEHVLGMPRSY